MGVKATTARLFTGMHGKLMKLTGGMGSGTADGSFMVLKHKRAKSSTIRETPVMFINFDDGYVIAASKGGAPENPSWYHNLKANPDTTVHVDREDVPVHAREIIGDERQTQWDRFTAMADRWDEYAAKTDRTIPLIHLEPR